ncbi:hypothetical protein [Streptomyces longwoodensis]
MGGPTSGSAPIGEPLSANLRLAPRRRNTELRQFRFCGGEADIVPIGRTS